jgi:hypothetical protein
MERLTYWCDNGHGGGKWFVAIDAEGREDYGPHVDRLAAYEDTGLEPEEVRRCLEFEDICLDEYIKYERLHELAQADREGKLPKYTIGDTVYDRFGMAWTVDSLEYVQCTYEKKWLYRCGHPGTDDYRGLYQDEVLTRAEAAAALRREQE